MAGPAARGPRGSGGVPWGRLGLMHSNRSGIDATYSPSDTPMHRISIRSARAGRLRGEAHDAEEDQRVGQSHRGLPRLRLTRWSSSPVPKPAASPGTPLRTENGARPSVDVVVAW